ncbi:MAG: hypothetical protein ACI3XI_06780 [Eubacteriales bacterium]
MSNTKIQLKATRVESIEYKNNMQGSGQLKIGFKYSYNLRHGVPGMARGEVSITAEDKEAPDMLSVTVRQSGIFELPGDMDREQAHLETFRILFPHAAATLTAVTSIAGVQGIVVPRIDISAENVYRVEFKPPKPEQ